MRLTKKCVRRWALSLKYIYILAMVCTITLQIVGLSVSETSMEIIRKDQYGGYTYVGCGGIKALAIVAVCMSGMKIIFNILCLHQPKTCSEKIHFSCGLFFCIVFRLALIIIAGFVLYSLIDQPECSQGSGNLMFTAQLIWAIETIVGILIEMATLILNLFEYCSACEKVIDKLKFCEFCRAKYCDKCFGSIPPSFVPPERVAKQDCENCKGSGKFIRECRGLGCSCGGYGCANGEAEPCYCLRLPVMPKCPWHFNY